MKERKLERFRKLHDRIVELLKLHNLYKELQDYTMDLIYDEGVVVEEHPPTVEFERMIEPIIDTLLTEFPEIDLSIATRIVLMEGDIPSEAIEFFLLERLSMFEITSIKYLEELVDEYYTLIDFAKYVYTLYNPPKKKGERK